MPGWEQRVQFLYSPCCFFFPCGKAPMEKGDLMFCLSLSASSSSSYLSSSSSSSASLWWGLECWEAEGDGGTEEGLGYLKPSVWQGEKQVQCINWVPPLVLYSNLGLSLLPPLPVSTPLYDRGVYPVPWTTSYPSNIAFCKTLLSLLSHKIISTTQNPSVLCSQNMLTKIQASIWTFKTVL